MEVIYNQARILLEAGDTPVDAFEKLTAAHQQVTQDAEARTKFDKELRGFISYIWPEVRKKSIAAKVGRRI